MYAIGIDAPKKLYNFFIMTRIAHYFSKLAMLARSHIPNCHHTIIDHQRKTKQKFEVKIVAKNKAKKLKWR